MKAVADRGCMSVTSKGQEKKGLISLCTSYCFSLMLLANWPVQRLQNTLQTQRISKRRMCFREKLRGFSLTG